MKGQKIKGPSPLSSPVEGEDASRITFSDNYTNLTLLAPFLNIFFCQYQDLNNIGLGLITLVSMHLCPDSGKVILHVPGSMLSTLAKPFSSRVPSASVVPSGNVIRYFSPATGLLLSSTSSISIQDFFFYSLRISDHATGRWPRLRQPGTWQPADFCRSHFFHRPQRHPRSQRWQRPWAKQACQAYPVVVRHRC